MVVRPPHGAPVDDPRDCRLYRIWGTDPHERGISPVLLYIGETARQPFTRWMEHVHEQEWAWRITAMVADERVFGSKAEVLAAERVAVRAEQPIYNTEHNRANPWRIAVAARRRPPRVYRRRPVAAPAPGRVSRWVGWLRSTPVLFVGPWLVLAGGGWFVAAHWASTRGVAGVKAGAGFATCVYGVAGVWWLRRWWRRKMRSLRRRWRG